MKDYTFRCSGVTKAGKPCVWPVSAEGGRCINHDPARAAELSAISSKRGEASARHRVKMRKLEECRLRTPGDLLALLEREALRVTNAEKADATSRASAICQLVKQAVEVLKAAELERENAQLKEMLLEIRPELRPKLRAVR